MWFKVFTIGLLACAVLSFAVLANDGRIPNIIDPSDANGEHPWGGDNYNNDPLWPTNFSPITPGIIPQGIFIRLAVGHFVTQITNATSTTVPVNRRRTTATPVVQQPSRPNQAPSAGGN